MTSGYGTHPLGSQRNSPWASAFSSAFPIFRPHSPSAGTKSLTCTRWLESFRRNVNQLSPRSGPQILTSQEKGYFVLSNLLRCVDIVNGNPTLGSEVVVRPTTTPAIAGEVYSASEDGYRLFFGGVEVPVSDFVDELRDDKEVVIKSSAKHDQISKESYASVLMHLKGAVSSFSPPPMDPGKAFFSPSNGSWKSTTKQWTQSKC